LSVILWVLLEADFVAFSVPLKAVAEVINSSLNHKSEAFVALSSSEFSSVKQSTVGHCDHFGDAFARL
jgi:hypothetical protein